MADITHPASLIYRIRPEVARRRIESFSRRFGIPHLYLAQHAAFPLALTSDLLYRLWANFQQPIPGKRLNIPWIAVADLLLSNLCDVVGHELYEMNISIRTALLSDLKNNPDFGSLRINELSSFLLYDIQHQLESPNPDIQTLAKAQQWTALAYTHPEAATEELAKALLASIEQEDKVEQLRVVSLIETFAEPLEGFAPLLTYARRVGYLARGDREGAMAQFKNVAGQEPFIQIQGVRLPPLTQTKRKVLSTLLIGLGGFGNEIVRRVKREMLQHNYDLPIFQYLVLDTMFFDERPGMNPHMHLRNGEEYLYLGNYDPNDILKNVRHWPAIAKWWGTRETHNLPTVDEGSGQMRAVGRMAFFRHFKEIYAQLDRMMGEVMSAANRSRLLSQGYEVPADRAPIIYLVFSLCGGTGSSLFFDVAYVLRSLFASKNIKPTIVAIAVLPEPYTQQIHSTPQQDRLQANTYAALQELERLHDMALGHGPRTNRKFLWDVQYATNTRISSDDLPLDYIYLVDNTTLSGEYFTLDQIVDLVSQALFWLIGPPTALHFWERAKNLVSNNLVSGGTPDASGRRHLAKYSSLGIRKLTIDQTADTLRLPLSPLPRTECLWGFREEVSQQVQPYLEYINFLGFGGDITSSRLQHELRSLLGTESQADIVSTNIPNELVLLKTSHGLPITAVNGISQWHKAYQRMSIIRNASYLHLDNSKEALEGYMPLAYLDIRHIDFIQTWENIASNLEIPDKQLAEYIRVPLQSYRDYEAQQGNLMQVIQVSSERDIICQFVDIIESGLEMRQKTAVTIPVYMALADAIDLVKARGWIKRPGESWSHL